MNVSALFHQAMQRLNGGASFVQRVDIIPQTRMTGPMPWVIAIMVAMTAIALAAGLALGNAVSSTRAEIEGGVTVQIIEPRAELRAEQAAKAVIAIKAISDVQGLRLVPREELDALIEPWLDTKVTGNSDLVIPIPALIDVRMKGPTTPAQLDEISKRVRVVAPSARIDAQSNWLRPVFDAMVSLQWLAIAVVALLAFGLAAAVLLAARSALGTNRDTIEIVHLLGGTDAQVAKVFQRSIGYDAAAGGAFGLTLAFLIIVLLAQRFKNLGAGLVDSGALIWSDWLLLAGVPVLATLLAMLTARLTVLYVLRKML